MARLPTPLHSRPPSPRDSETIPLRCPPSTVTAGRRCSSQASAEEAAPVVERRRREGGLGGATLSRQRLQALHGALRLALQARAEPAAQVRAALEVLQVAGGELGSAGPLRSGGERQGRLRLCGGAEVHGATGRGVDSGERGGLSGVHRKCVGSVERSGDRGGDRSGDCGLLRERRGPAPAEDQVEASSAGDQLAPMSQEGLRTLEAGPAAEAGGGGGGSAQRHKQDLATRQRSQRGCNRH